ncbi:MAG: biliverdin-producing heme oxygenase [Pseudomonadota bacterium]|nr:biliverdin-producing heme oxygenase [Pseudomonadota bacterium]
MSSFRTPDHAPSGSTLREQLRAATAAAHARVDAAMPLTRPGVTLTDYQQHLLILLDWLVALEQLLPEQAWLADERHAIAQDAATCTQLLGDAGAPGAPRPLSLSRWQALLDGPRRDAACWGVRYVIEGSHLGGQVLYRRLSTVLAPHPLDYLRAGGAGTPGEGRWRRFLLALDDQDWPPPARRHAIEAAQAAFELLIACLDAHGAPLESATS